MALYLLIIFLWNTVGIKYSDKALYPYFDTAERVAFSATVAIVLFLVFRLISKNIMLTILGVVISVGYFFILPSPFSPNHLNHSSLWLMVALVIMVFPAPFLFHQRDNQQFWAWVQQVLFIAILAGLFSFLLFLGFMGVEYGLKKLFDMEFAHTVEKQLSMILFLGFGLSYFLSHLPKYPTIVPLRTYTMVESYFVKYLLLGLTVVYGVMLYLYSLKMLFMAQFPSGYLASMILLFSALGIVTMLFAIPFKGEKKESYQKWLWLAILFQLPLLFWSIFLRVEQYGLTEKRYMLLAFAFYLLAITIYFLWSKKAHFKWIFIGLSLTILFTQFGGDYSARELSKRSQVAHLRALLGVEENLTNESNVTLRYKLSDAIGYIHREYGIESLMPLIPEIVSNYQLRESNSSVNCVIEDKRYFPQYATKALGFDYVAYWEWKQANTKGWGEAIDIAVRESTGLLHVKEYDWIDTLDYYNYREDMLCPPNNLKGQEESLALQLIKSREKIVIMHYSEELAEVSFHEFLEGVKKLYRERVANSTAKRETLLSKKELEYHFENDKLKVKVAFSTLHYTLKGKLEMYHGTIFIKEK